MCYLSIFDTETLILLTDSDSDSDFDGPHYSIHDSRYPRRKKSALTQQSQLCVSLGINKGRITAYTPCKVGYSI